MTNNDAAQVAELLGLSLLSAPGLEDGAVPAVDAEVGSRVRGARVRSGLTAAKVAEVVGLSKDKLSKIENGKRRISARELAEFARALSVPLTVLLGTTSSGRPALALAHRISAGSDPQAFSSLREHAAALLEAEDRLEQQAVLPPRTLSPAGAAITTLSATDYASTPRTKNEARLQGRAFAEEVRRVLELGTSEIGDLPGLVEMHFAADVALSPLGSGSDGMCAHQGGAALLVVNTDGPLGRTRFTLAHELGHHLFNDPRDVIEEGSLDMYSSTFVEQRVNAFAGHLLLPVKAVRAAAAWLGADQTDLAGTTARGSAVLGYLMVRYGVSLPCALQQVLEAGLLNLEQKLSLSDKLRAADLIGAAEHLIAGRPRPDQTLRDRRPPARLATAVVDAARAGLVGMRTAAIVLDRADDDALFDEVMYGPAEPGEVTHDAVTTT